jgi:hypothetical protein
VKSSRRDGSNPGLLFGGEEGKPAVVVVAGSTAAAPPFRKIPDGDIAEEEEEEDDDEDADADADEGACELDGKRMGRSGLTSSQAPYGRSRSRIKSRGSVDQKQKALGSVAGAGGEGGDVTL